jgi:hypothetical protein
MDEGLYIVSKVNKSTSSIIGISDGKLVEKQFWNGDVGEIIEFVKDYIKSGIWDNGCYFKVGSDTFRANSKKEAEKFCSENKVFLRNVIYSRNFIQI